MPDYTIPFQQFKYYFCFFNFYSQETFKIPQKMVEYISNSRRVNILFLLGNIKWRSKRRNQL